MDDTTAGKDEGGSRPQPQPSTPIYSVPATAIRRFGARVLDPDTAEVLGSQSPVQPTVYIPDRLVLPGLNGRAAGPDRWPTGESACLG